MKLINRAKWYGSFLTFLLLAFGYNFSLVAQTPSDALMMPAKNICVLVSYDSGSFDQYWEGSELRANQTIATVYRNTFLPMAAIGLWDNLNFYIGLPYVRTESSNPNGGKFTEAKGLQDIGLALKYRAIKKSFAGGELTAFGTVGFSTPVTNYLADYMPYSIGIGAPEFSTRAISQYQWNNGFYLRGSLAHLWRGYTEAERDYYYNDGSVYSAWMDVPNAWTYDGALGKWFFDAKLRVELIYSGLSSTSGDDIRAYNAPQPTNQVVFDRVGILAQFYFKSIDGLGMVAYFNRVVNGRNMPQITNAGLGITYQFNVINETKNQAHAE